MLHIPEASSHLRLPRIFQLGRQAARRYGDDVVVPAKVMRSLPPRHPGVCGPRDPARGSRCHAANGIVQCGALLHFDDYDYVNRARSKVDLADGKPRIRFARFSGWQTVTPA